MLPAGRHQEAAQAFEKLRQLAPNADEAHARIGLIHFQQRKFELAAPELRQGIKLNPALPKTDLLLAMALSELGEFKEALSVLERGSRA